MNDPGTLYFMIGKMGAGKSTWSAAFAKQHGVTLLSSDDWITRLYPGEIQTFDDFIARYVRLLDVLAPHLEQLLVSGCNVILDFPANTVEARRWFFGVAAAAKAQHEAIYLDVPDEICLQQIAKRRDEQPDRQQFDTVEMFEEVSRFFEVPTIDEGLNLRAIEISRS